MTEIGAYRVGRLVGRGGFAAVYEGTHPQTGEPVAVKVIQKRLLAQRGAEKRVRNEVSLLECVRHEGVVQLKSSFEDAHCIYLVMELCRHGDLHEFVRRHGPLPEPLAASITQQLASALHHLHGRCIAHRDVTLSNLLIHDSGRVKLADFGLAAQLSVRDEPRHTLCGTPDFISPEMALRIPHGAWVDLWALGCVAYALLVGEPPFRSWDPRDTLERVRALDYDLPPSLSPAAASFVNGLLQRDPQRRLALRDALEHPFLAREPCAPEQLLSWIGPVSRSTGAGNSSSPAQAYGEAALYSETPGDRSASREAAVEAPAAAQRAVDRDGGGCGDPRALPGGEGGTDSRGVPWPATKRRRPPSRHVGDVIAPQRTIVAAAQPSSVLTHGGPVSGTCLSDAFAADDEAEAEAEVEAPTPRRPPGRRQGPMPHPDLLSSHDPEWAPRPAPFPRPAVLDSRRGSSTSLSAASESTVGPGAKGDATEAPPSRRNADGPPPAPSRLLQTGFGMRPQLRRASWRHSLGRPPRRPAPAPMECDAGTGAAFPPLTSAWVAAQPAGQGACAMRCPARESGPQQQQQQQQHATGHGEQRMAHAAAPPLSTAQPAHCRAVVPAPSCGDASDPHFHHQYQQQQQQQRRRWQRRRRRAKRALSHASAPAAPLGGSVSVQSPHYRATGETIVAGGGSPPQKVESPPPAGLAYRQESEEVAMQDRSGSDAEAEEQQGTAQLDTAQSWGQHRPRSRPYALEDRHELTAGVLAVSAGGGGRRGAAVAGAHTPPDGAYCAGAYSACHSARSEWQHWGALEPSEGEEGGSAARAPANAARPASQWAREGAAPEDAVPLPSARVEPLQGFLAAGPSPRGTPGGGGRWLPQGRHAYRLGDDRAPGAAAAWVAIAPDPQAGDGAHWHTVVCVSATPWGDAALRLRALGAVLDVDLPRDMALAVMGADAVVARERSASGSPHGRFCVSVPAGGDQPEGWHAPLWLYLAAVQRSVRECVPLCRAVREGPHGEDVHLRCYGAAAGPASVLAVVQGCGTVHADLRSGTVRATRGEEGGEGGDHLSVHLDDPVEQAGGLPHWAAPLLCAALQCAGDLLRGLCPGKEQGQAVDAADTLAPGDSASESAWQDQWPGEEGAAVSWSAASLLSAAGPAVVGADATHMHTERVGEWAAPDAVGAGKGLPCERAARELVQEVQRLVEGPPLAAAADSDAGEAQARGGGGGGGGLARLADAGPGTEVTTPPRVSALAAADTPPLPRSAEAIDQGPRGSERATEKDGVGAPRRAVVDWWRDQGTGQLCVIWRPPAAAAAPASRLDVERWSLSADGRTLRRGGAFGRTFPTAPSAAKLPAPARAVLRAMLHILDQEQ